MKVSSEKVDSLLNEIVRSERDVKSLNLEQTLKTKTEEGFNDYKKKYLTFERWDWSLWTATNGLITILQSLVLVLSVVFMDKGLMTLAAFMIIYSNRHAFFFLTRILGNVANYFTEISVALERINELYTNQEYKMEHFGNRNLKEIKGKIEFKNVSFSYPEFKERDKKEIEQEKKYNKKHKIKTPVQKRIEIGRKQVLNKMNFEIEPNTTVSFVGVSGSGKSTILNLISKMYEVDKGKVMIDGVDVKTLSKETMRKAISLVNQSPYIFDMTIKENLLLSKPDATEEEITTAIKESALEDFIADLPEGINTKVGESGIKLSGGQKQRLAIARAMLRKSPIIIFDESTSSLDNISQNQIKKSIDKINGKSTVVIVAHRLSTIKNVDKIFFLEHGEIVDQGTFKELYKNNKKFKTIFLAENIEN
jgi:ATP-binding cassette subfamily B protein